MKFSDHDLAAHLTSAETKQVKAMERGGTAGGNGYAYEDYFAVSHLLKGIRRTVDDSTSPDLAVTRQGRAAVDDVIIRDGTTHRFHQLKTSPDTTWSAHRHKISRQFRTQRKLCRGLGMQFSMALVTPHPNRRQLLLEKRPSDLADVDVTLFAEIDRRPEFWSASGCGRTDLQSIVASSALCTPTNIESIGLKVFDCWYDRRDADGYVSAVSSYGVLMDDESLPIARPTPSVIPEHRAIIDSLIPMGITVSIDRGYCHWTCGYEAGQIGAYGRPAADRFFARLTSHPPTTEDDFLELVP